MKHIFSLILVFFVSLSSVFALDLTYTSLTPEVLPGEDVSYLVTLHNTADVGNEISLKSIDLRWFLREDIVHVYVPGGQSKEIRITFEPIGTIKAGNYGINLVATTEDERVERYLPAVVLPYKGLLDFTLDQLPLLDPKKKTRLSFSVVNMHEPVLESVVVQVESELFPTQKKVVTLGSHESQTLDFTLDVADSVIEGEYTLHLTARYNNEVVHSESITVTVKRYEHMQELIQRDEGFLVSGEMITRVNEGNAVLEDTIVRDFSLVHYWFTSFEPEPHVSKVDGRYVVTWEVFLEPGDQRSVSYSTNYVTPALVLLLVSGLLYGLYYFMKRSVSVTRKVLVMKRQGGMYQLHVTLTLRNTTRRTLQRLRVLEVVPHVDGKPEKFGTYEPTLKKGTSLNLLWEFAVLGSGETRVLTYTVNIKSSHGSFVLSSTIVRYSDGDKRELARSSSFSLT